MLYLEEQCHATALYAVIAGTREGGGDQPEYGCRLDSADLQVVGMLYRSVGRWWPYKQGIVLTLCVAVCRCPDE